MASLDHIRTRGFKRWYERQLIECHAWLVTCFLGIICVASGLEVMGQSGSPTRMVGFALTAGGLALAMLSWHRYRAMLTIAERLGERAVCPDCGAYSKFRIVASGPAPLPDGGDADIDALGEKVWLRAHCRKCEREWLL